MAYNQWQDTYVSDVTNDLQHVPTELIDYNLCLAAVKNNQNALRFVPEIYKTFELCLIVVDNHPYWDFNLIPLEHHFKLICYLLDNQRIIVSYFEETFTQDQIEYIILKYGN